MPTCSSCGEENPARARFCLACGTPLTAAASPPREARKTVTAVFCDVVGSTSLGERLDAESLRRVMARYFRALQEALERHGGTVEKFIGDAVMAVFGIPSIHEDDALRAVRAAADMQAALEALNDELDATWNVRIEARIGVNTGEVVAGDSAQGQAFATGDAVNVAARLEQAAEPGQILLGSATERLVRHSVRVEPVEPLALKGKAQPVPAFRLVEVLPQRTAVVRELKSPLVGRQRELRLLERAFERAVEARRCELVTVLGGAGVGKSRLTREFIALLGPRATVVRGRCLPYGEGITYWPVAEVVKAAVAIRDEDSRDQARARLADELSGSEDAAALLEPVGAALGLTDRVVQQEEIFWALRRLLETIARARPLVAVFDDIHSAEPTFLDLLDYLDAASRDAPILLLCMARPELIELRPRWPDDRADALVRLDPLGGEESRALLENLLGHDTLPEQVSTRIAEVAEGNPLFVEEFLRMLVDDGHLRRGNGHLVPVGGLSGTPMPATIDAILGARLDRLTTGERAVIERAAVIGQVFWAAAVSDLSPSGLRVELGRHLQGLVTKELVHPGHDSFAGEDGYRFGHLLIRDAAYGATLKELRTDFHERFAGWVERKAGERAGEYDEVIGYHLEQAYGYRRDLGTLDAAADELALRAAEHLGGAGHRAVARGDMSASANLLGRAAGLLAPGMPQRLGLLPELGFALGEVGEPARAEAILEEAVTTARLAADDRLQWRAALEHAWATYLNRAVYGDGLDTAREAVDALTRAGDEEGLARAWQLLGVFRLFSGNATAAHEALDRALTHALTAGARRVQSETLVWLLIVYVMGPMPADEGIQRCEAALRSSDNPKVRAYALIERGVLTAMQGRIDAGRHDVAEGRALLREVGLDVWAAITSVESTMVELLADNAAGAKHGLVAARETLERMGEQGFASSILWALADVACFEGDHHDALRLSDQTAAMSSAEDPNAQVSWRRVKAMSLAHLGELDEAERLAREAVNVAYATDLPIHRGDANLALGAVFACSGRTDEAAATYRRAEHEFLLKGDLVTAAKARALAAGGATAT